MLTSNWCLVGGVGVGDVLRNVVEQCTICVNDTLTFKKKAPPS